MVGKSFILVSFSFERVSSTAVMDQRVGTSFLFFLRPRRPAERILTSCSVSVCLLIVYRCLRHNNPLLVLWKGFLGV